MFLGLVISVIPRKSVIFGGKSVGVAGLEPKQIQSSKQELLGSTKTEFISF
jgi:hypothetical protein